jgi:hypothetical protein
MTVDVPGAGKKKDEGSILDGINDNDQIMGSYTDRVGLKHGFISD